MIQRILQALTLSFLCLQPAIAAAQEQAKPPAKPAAQEKEQKDPFKLFHWLTDSNECQGLVVENRKLANLSSRNLDVTPAEIETEVTRPDAKSMRITKRIYDTGASGERILSQVVVEDVRITAGNGISATRTLSRNDINGRLQVVQKETQDTVAAGPDTYRTRATIMASGINGTMTKAEEVLQVEKKKGEGAVEIQRTQSLPDVNGNLSTSDRRTTSTHETEGQILFQGEIYKPDVNGRLALAQQTSGREWQDQEGSQHQNEDTYIADQTGKMQLFGRSAMVRSSYADGSEQTTQDFLQISPVSPSEGFKLVRKIVETSRPADSNPAEKETQVLAPDANGKLQTILYQRVEEKK